MQVLRTRDARTAVRVSTQDQVEIEQAGKVRAYSSPSALIRVAIRNELHRRQEVTGIEEGIGASFERLSNEYVRLGRAVQALFALVDTLSKTVLTCIPETAAGRETGSGCTRQRTHHRLIKFAGLAMSVESRATIEKLVTHDPGR